MEEYAECDRLLKETLRRLWRMSRLLRLEEMSFVRVARTTLGWADTAKEDEQGQHAEGDELHYALRTPC